jgi:ketosteroid isomerase-like protein
MTITSERVREIFRKLENGDGAAFFEQVAHDVDWTVMGTHPLAGPIPQQERFHREHVAKLNQVLPQGAQLHLEHLLVQG